MLRKPGAWEKTYRRLNIEVLVRRDRPDFGSALSWWADYGTYLPEGCWICGDGRLTCADHTPCCPGAGSMAHVRGCKNHPEADDA